MASDPGYVRLADRLSSQVVSDLESGWSIAGLDVKEFPNGENEKRAARQVKRWLNQGVLEPASKAEHQEVQAILDTDTEGVQEHDLQKTGEEVRSSIRKARAANPVDDEDDSPKKASAVKKS